MSRNPILSVQINGPMRAALVDAASAAKTSVSGYVRNVIVAALPKAAALPALLPAPARRPRHLSEPDVAAIASILAAINRLNGSMVQFSKALREAGHISEHRTMESAIADVLDLKAEGVRIFRRLQE